MLGNGMPKGLKASSAPITISFQTDETAANVFSQAQIAMQLNVLDREVMVVTGLNLDVSTPDAQAGVNTATGASLSTTSRTTLGALSDSNVIGVSLDSIRAAGFVDGGVSFTAQYGESPAAGMDYLAIIATNDFFVQVQGAGNLAAKAVHGKLYCYRAIADAATFAALTQSELLSA
ncbi:MAG: hypothetical protein [Circular genetic element sp.]|nr:MAG: hypothetical protein [Circular genetic element sp.]